MERVTLRAAGQSDWAWCRAMEHSLTDDLLERKLDLGEIFVASERGGAVGYIRLEYLWSRWPYIGLIVVREGARGRGVGRAMLGQLEGFLRAGGHEALYSSSQANELEPQEWHRKAGFEDCGAIRGLNPDGSDEIFFRKRL